MVDGGKEVNETKFDGKGSIYARNRPSYPQEFIDFLYADIGVNANSIVADIGSGTGKLTRLLLERGSKVFAVEPNADMRANAEADLRNYDRFFSINGKAENATLDDCSIDFVTVATAFHWFDKQAFKAECRRILKKDGKVIIVYNSRDEESDLVKCLYKVNEKYCPDFKGFTGSGMLLRHDSAGFFSDFFTDDYLVKIIENNLVYNERGFVERSLSSSYALKEGDACFLEYVKELSSLFQEHSMNNELVMPNITHGYVGTV